ncbi:MAG: Crp/Fnr family transcriptional regulator [Chloroflexi bacterium]|nr:MAG: Crp/Fnr family transcriptional regulator [Chloroflexota bacterium]
MSRKRVYLASVDLLRDLSAEEMAEVESHTQMVRYPPGHLFYLPDDPAEVLFILKEGRVQLYRMSADGRKFVIAELHGGSIFGHMALVGQRLHDTFAQALEDCLICRWNREQVEQLLMQRPLVALRFLESMGQRLIQAEQQLEDMTFKRVPARLASLILRLISENGQGNRLQGYTHQSLADMLGIYRETTTQILNDFQSRNLIRIGRKTIEIIDRAGLMDVAEN